MFLTDCIGLAWFRHVLEGLDLVLYRFGALFVNTAVTPFPEGWSQSLPTTMHGLINRQTDKHKQTTQTNNKTITTKNKQQTQKQTKQTNTNNQGTNKQRNKLGQPLAHSADPFCFESYRLWEVALCWQIIMIRGLSKLETQNVPEADWSMNKDCDSRENCLPLWRSVM